MQATQMDMGAADLFTEKQVMLLLERDDQAKQEMEDRMAEVKREAQADRAEQKQEMEALVKQVEAKLTPTAAISGGQIASLGARLEALHAAQLLSDEELFTLEDAVADYVELQSSMGVITLEAAHAIRAADKLVKLVALSEHIAADGAFSRQARRKYL